MITKTGQDLCTEGFEKDALWGTALTGAGKAISGLKSLGKNFASTAKGFGKSLPQGAKGYGQIGKNLVDENSYLNAGKMYKNLRSTHGMGSFNALKNSVRSNMGKGLSHIPGAGKGMRNLNKGLGYGTAMAGGAYVGNKMYNNPQPSSPFQYADLPADSLQAHYYSRQPQFAANFSHGQRY